MSNNDTAATDRNAQAAALWTAMPLRSRTALIKRILSNPAGASAYVNNTWAYLPSNIRAEITGRLLGWT
jgi:hypothetical protein